MSDQKQYGIIREQGEFMDPVMLNDKDNQKVNESVNQPQDDNQKDK